MGDLATSFFCCLKSWPEVSDNVSEFVFGHGLHCFIWSKYVAQPGQEPECSIEAIGWYDVHNLGYFGKQEKQSPYLPSHWRNGGSGSVNKDVFKGGHIATKVQHPQCKCNVVGSDIFIHLHNDSSCCYEFDINKWLCTNSSYNINVNKR